LPNYVQQYKKLYEAEKKKRQQLEKENQGLRRKVLLIPDKFRLNERQLAIIDYVRKHPGSTKTGLIEKLQNSEARTSGFGTYVTLHKEIQYLVKLNMIRVEEVHKQKHRLYLNENSLLLEIHTDLTNFKNSFYELLDNLSRSVKWQEYTTSKYWRESFDAKRVLHSLILIYNHVFNVYLTKIMLIWSVELKHDEFLLNKIYSLILFVFIEIQTEFTKKFDLTNKLPKFDKDTTDRNTNPILYQITSKTFFLDPYTIMAIIRDFYEFGLHFGVVPLIDASWKEGFDLYRFMEGNHLNDFDPQINAGAAEDWKKLLSFYLNKKFRIDGIPPIPSRFTEPRWFHSRKDSIRKILNEIKQSSND
jgi:hypothetical protein